MGRLDVVAVEVGDAGGVGGLNVVPVGVGGLEDVAVGDAVRCGQA